MAQLQLNSGKRGEDTSPPLIKRILSICLILISLGTVASFAMGYTSLSISREIKENENYIVVAKEIQPNFEESLTLYTGETQKIIAYLLRLRPASEEDYITFLTALEGLGNKLKLKLDIKSLELGPVNPKADPEPSNSLDYDISFYGSFKNLLAFVEELEKLPYYIKVANIRFMDPNGDGEDGSLALATPSVSNGGSSGNGSSGGGSSSKHLPNLNLKIKLYVK
ncbi:MAG: hypothetical protein WC604_02150 [Candidatus Gracilibacteria bacterium]